MKIINPSYSILLRLISTLLMLGVFSSCQESVYANKDESSEIETIITVTSPAVNASNKNTFDVNIHCPSVAKRITVSGSISALIECQKVPFTTSLDLSAVPDGTIRLKFTPNVGRSSEITLEKDVIEPTVGGLTNDLAPIAIKNWTWTCLDTSATCSFRHVISRSPIYIFTTEAFNSIPVATKNTGNGTYYLHVQAKDAAGNISATQSVSAILSNPTPPLIYIVSPGTTEIISGIVDLQLFTSLANTQMYITNTPGCSDGGTWEPYATSKTGWTLNPAQAGGTAAVFVKYRDASFTETACVNDTITWRNYYRMCTDQSSTEARGLLYDDGGPGGNYTNNAWCDFTITSATPFSILVKSINLSPNDVLSIGGGFVALGTSTPGLINLDINLNNGENFTVANLYLKDRRMNLPAGTTTINFISDGSVNSSGFEISWQAEGDVSPPEGQMARGSISINNGAASTAESLVTLNINFGSLAEMYVTNTPNCVSGGAWEDVSAVKTWILPGSEGQKNVYIKFRDSYLHESKCEVDSIYLDLSTPLAPIISSVGPAFYGDKAPALHFIDTDLGVDNSRHEARILNAANNSVIKDWTELGPGDQLTPVSLQTNTGYYFELRFIENSGRISAAAQSEVWYIRPLISLGPIINLALTENSGTVAFDVESSVTLGSALTVSFTVAGEAIAGTDHTLMPGTITIPAGQSSARVSFQIIDDNLPETDERLRILLQSPPSALYTLHKYYQVEYLILANDGGLTPPQATKVTAGVAHTCAVVNGGIQCWGNDQYSQLGNGAESSSTPVPIWTIPPQSGATDIETQNMHTCAVVAGGVQCWGWNGYGQLGNRSQITPFTPVQAISSGSGVTSVAAGGYHSCAMANGGVRCWGYNFGGTVGDGTTTMRTAPVQVIPELSGVTKLTVGDLHTCVIINGGVQCWGRNSYGEVGDSTLVTRTVPTTVIPSFSGVTDIVGGETHTCAIVSGGIKCWGDNSRGQLGTGDQLSRSIPTDVLPAGSGATSILAGFYYSCALVSGKVLCWGANNSGQIGDGTTIDRLVPVEVLPAARGATSITTGIDHTCAVVIGGTLCWGRGDYHGEYGNNSFQEQLVPAEIIPAGSQISAVAAGSYHTCALANGGTLCWGSNDSGQLGDGSKLWKTYPVGISPPGSQVTQVVTGESTTCSIINGGLKCQGANSGGQIGDGTTTSRSHPVSSFPAGSGVATVSSGQHTCVVLNGGVQCWGNNTFGQVGDGTVTHRHTPTLVIPAGSQVTAVSAGLLHSCAVMNGGLKCWGLNDNGQIGDGSMTDRYVPTTVYAASSGVTAVATGESSTCAIVSGSVRCWGRNTSGQVGDNSLLNRLTPVSVVPAISGATIISSLGGHSCALANGGVRCWGANDSGQLGVGDRNNRGSTVEVFPPGSGITSVAAGRFHSCAVQNGGVKCWGAAKDGRLGLPAIIRTHQWVFSYAQ